MTGWLEVELGGRAIVHLESGSHPVVAPQGRSLAEWDAAPVRLVGGWGEPWHPRGRPPFRVTSIEAWTDGTVTAPGVPPLTRVWMGTRLRGRAALRARITERFPDHAGLVGALLLADRSGLAPEVRDRFARAGTAHLLAISGFHVGILAGWIVILLGGVGVSRRHRPGIAALATWGYVGMIGFPTSAVRAAAIVTLLALGRLRGRPVHPLGAWATALAAVAWIDPSALRGPGAQLSFAGSFGLLRWAAPWARRLGGDPPEPDAPFADRCVHATAVAIAVSAAAQVATAPLVAWHFQRVPLAGLPASVVATPFVAAALPGAVVALALPAGVLAAPWSAGAAALLDATRVVVDLLAGGPGTLWAGPPLLAALGAGAGLGVVAARIADARRRHPALLRETSHERGQQRRRSRLRAAGVGAWCGLLLLPAIAGMVPRALEVHLLDVGQGDAILVRSPRGAWTLVDAGPGGGEDLLRALARRGVTRLEALVVTHPDLDHVGGAAGVVRSIPVKAVVGSGLLRGTGALSELLLAAEERSVPWRVAESGQSWSVDGVEWQVVHAGGSAAGPNDRSVVLHVRYGRFDLLLTGDVSSSIEDGLPGRLAEGTTVEVLKVAHHGSATSTSEAFLDALRPQVAVVSVGRRNRFGHPARPVVARFARRAIPLLRTDEGGDITVRGWRDGSFDALERFGGRGRIRGGSRSIDGVSAIRYAPASTDLDASTPRPGTSTR